MKRKRLLLVLLTAGALLAAVLLGAFQEAGAVRGLTYFSYSAGHPWSGYTILTVEVTGGVPVARYQVTMEGINEGEPGQDGTVELSQAQLNEFERLLGNIRIRAWKAAYGPDPMEITDQDSWHISLRDGKGAFETSGYYERPAGLEEIVGYFNGLVGDRVRRRL